MNRNRWMVFIISFLSRARISSSHFFCLPLGKVVACGVAKKMHFNSLARDMILLWLPGVVWCYILFFCRGCGHRQALNGFAFLLYQRNPGVVRKCRWRCTSIFVEGHDITIANSASVGWFCILCLSIQQSTRVSYLILFFVQEQDIVTSVFIERGWDSAKVGCHCISFLCRGRGFPIASFFGYGSWERWVALHLIPQRGRDHIPSPFSFLWMGRPWACGQVAF